MTERSASYWRHVEQKVGIAGEQGSLMKTATLRVARPTDNMEALVAMYAKGLGLEILARFDNHDGFDGVILGSKGAPYHLEFTAKQGHRAGPAPTQDNLLVFYLPDRGELGGAVRADAGSGVSRRGVRSTRTGTRRGGPSRTWMATASCCRTQPGGREPA